MCLQRIFSTQNSLNHFHNVLFFSFSSFSLSSLSTSGLTEALEEATWVTWPELPTWWSRTWRKDQYKPKSLTSSKVTHVCHSRTQLDIQTHSGTRQLKVSVQIAPAGGSVIALQRITYCRTSLCSLVLTVLWQFPMAMSTHSLVPALYQQADVTRHIIHTVCLEWRSRSDHWLLITLPPSTLTC